MDSIVKMVVNELERREMEGLNLTTLEKKINISSGSLTHFKKGTELGFDSFIKLISVLFQESQFNSVIREVCKKIQKPKNVKMALEFTILNGQYDVTLLLLEKAERENIKIGKWLDIYKLHLDFQNGTLVGNDLLKKVKETKSKLPPELVTALSLLEVYAHFISGNYPTVFQLLDILEHYLSAIEDGFFKECYQLRVNEVKAHCSLLKLKIHNARELAEEIKNKNFCAKLSSNAMYIIGMSFLFEDKRKCIDNLRAAYDILDKYGVNEKAEVAKHNLNFALIHFGEEVELDDLDERAHLEAKKGNTEKALKLLDECVKIEGDSAFKKYYRGIALKCRKTLYASLGEFRAKGDLFFAQLPKLALEKMGEESFILDAFFC
ncbi:AimR family lysis-lysogeny pheromone receptor [Fictibacillus sp. Mic-4]|uniref:AimR family lysis-lysogeny pheromone receptor n=1 Tax=Fictibacillus sp. Mic-4 TaxID=3132826 RepID=UPI003CFADCB6